MQTANNKQQTANNLPIRPTDDTTTFPAYPLAHEPIPVHTGDEHGSVLVNPSVVQVHSSYSNLVAIFVAAINPQRALSWKDAHRVIDPTSRVETLLKQDA